MKKYTLLLKVISALAVITFYFPLQAQKPNKGPGTPPPSPIHSPAPSLLYDKSAGCGPLVIKFKNTTPNSVSCFWNFGDGNTSGLNEPINIYKQPGKYTVRLTVTTTAGKKTQVYFLTLSLF